MVLSIDNSQLLDNPKFWLKKCAEKNLAKDLKMSWASLIKKVERSCLEQNVILCLQKMHKEAPHSFQSPLHMASEAGDLKLIQFILDHMDSSIGQNQNGKTPIHIAAMNGHSEVVKALAAYTDTPNAQGHAGWTPIQLAAMNGCAEVVKVLAAFTKNPNAPQYGGWTPIQLAAENGHTEVVKVLASLIEAPNAPGQNGWTPIQLAAEKGHIEVIKALAAYTDAPNAPGNDGRTPIRLAVENGHTEVVKILMAYSDTPIISTKDRTCSSLNPSVLSGHSDIVKALVAGPMPPYRQSYAKRRSYTPCARRRNALMPISPEQSPEKCKISFKKTTSQVTYDPQSPPCTIGLTKKVHKIPIKSEKSESTSDRSPTGHAHYTPYSNKIHSCKRAHHHHRTRQYDRSTFRSA